MTIRKKIILGIVIIIVVVLISGVIFIYNLITKSLPDTIGSIKNDKISEEVEIFRNDFDIPYIIAKNDYDMMFAFGYTVAQDRLWQMDLERRLGQGRLSEIFGKKTLELDILSRTLGFERIARRIENSLNSESRSALNAYSDGINYFIKNHNDKLPIEFDLLRYQPEEWQITHSLIILRLFAWEMNFSWWSDLVMGEILDRFGEKKASDIFPTYPTDGETIIRDSKGQITSTLKNFIDAHNVVKNVFGKSVLSGSNSWAISSEKGINGFPILANDPHLVLSLPAYWYIISLHSNNYDVSGVTIPGIPAIIIGSNRHIAWGITNGMVDECDFYLETVDSLGNNLFYNNNNWQKLISYKEKILVNKQEPFYLTVFQTKNGPIVSSFKGMKGTYQIKQQSFQQNQDTILKGTQISMRWSGFELSDEIYGILLVNRANNKSEFEGGLRFIKLPGLNFTYTDTNNIGYYLAAFVPIRKYQQSYLPVSGSSTKFEWQGFVPDNELPHIWNPPEKYIVTANNKIMNEYPYLISNLWESPSRAERIVEILKYKDKFTVEDFQKMQADVTSIHAKKLSGVILDVLNKFPSNDNYYNQAITYLRNWDFSISVGSISSAIFNVFFVKMLKNTFLDEMGQDLFERYCFLAFIPTNVLTKLIIENKPAWFDDVNTPGKMESRDEIIYRSFIEAIEYLKEKLGPESKNWRWDGLHTLTLRHPFGIQKPLDQIFNVGPFETAGSNTTINCGYYDLNNPFEHVVGPSMRFIVDMANVNEPQFIISSGQSGQFFSSHYQDQISLLLSGQYITVYNSPDKIRRMNYKLLRMER